MELSTPHSSGVAKAGLATGVTALGIGALNMLGNGGGILGNLFGWNGCGRGYGVGYGYDPVSHYELNQESALANKEAENALLRSTIYQDQKSLELYRYIDGKLAAHEAEIARLTMALNRERDERVCGDNSIVNYVNATFYPKMVASVTVGSETTAQAVYNPLPCYGGCNCNR